MCGNIQETCTVRWKYLGNFSIHAYDQYVLCVFSKYFLPVFIFSIKKLHQFGGVDYRYKTQEILHVILADDLIARVNLNGNKTKKKTKEKNWCDQNKSLMEDNNLKVHIYRTILTLWSCQGKFSRNLLNVFGEIWLYLWRFLYLKYLSRSCHFQYLFTWMNIRLKY